MSRQIISAAYHYTDDATGEIRQDRLFLPVTRYTLDNLIHVCLIHYKVMTFGRIGSYAVLVDPATHEFWITPENTAIKPFHNELIKLRFPVGDFFSSVLGRQKAAADKLHQFSRYAYLDGTLLERIACPFIGLVNNHYKIHIRPVAAGEACKFPAGAISLPNFSRRPEELSGEWFVTHEPAWLTLPKRASKNTTAVGNVT